MGKQHPHALDGQGQGQRTVCAGRGTHTVDAAKLPLLQLAPPDGSPPAYFLAQEKGNWRKSRSTGVWVTGLEVPQSSCPGSPVVLLR